MKRSFALAVHGGSGILSDYSLDERKDFSKALNEVIDLGVDLLSQGASSFDVVTECVARLEDIPIFNAGRGSVFNENGQIEMDACIMKDSLEAGAVGAFRSTKNPIRAARIVLEKTNHRLLTGPEAEKWILSQGIQAEKPEYFQQKHRYEQFLNFQKTKKIALDHGGTVGCVALDESGKMAAATSTGGLTGKKSGRISDSALVGAGTFAHSQTCAISATGTGDEFIRHTVAYDIHAQMLYLSKDCTQAGIQTLQHVAQTQGTGGIIAVDKQARCHHPFVSEGMLHAWRDGSQKRGDFLADL